MKPEDDVLGDMYVVFNKFVIKKCVVSLSEFPRNLPKIKNMAVNFKI